MIVTVTANPALDVTYAVEGLMLDRAQRVSEVHRQAGGKGMNVARALTLMGVPAVALGIVGGAFGDLIRQDLEDAAIAYELVEAEGNSRQTVTAWSPGGRFVELDEPGMTITAATWDALASALDARLEPGGVVAISGSLPRGVPSGAYRLLIELAHERHCRVVLDTSGPALELALASGVDVVKPNAAELDTLSRSRPETTEEILAACRVAGDAGASAVVASLGASGAVAMGASGAYRFDHPARTGNAVGAGDVLVAGLAAGLDERRSFVDCVRNGVEWAYASLGLPFAGWLDPTQVAVGHSVISVERLDVAPIEGAAVLRKAEQEDHS